MPAMLDDPTANVIFRTSGDIPYPPPGGPLPVGIAPCHVTLRDRVTAATLIPFSAPNQVPISLLAYLCDQLGREIEKGDTYPMIEPLPLANFGPYWFGVFGAIMLLGDIQDGRELHEMARRGCDWERECLGSFYIKPNYPGRSSHVCNGGFLVTDASRNRGVGRLMGETYLDWAPKLGYTYSVFNLVYETNVASCRIWDALGFKRIGRVKGCGNLKSYPGELVDAIIYGRDLGQEDELISEERFDKIRYYLKHSKYPNGADRAEKSRLRSAATHYKLSAATDTEPEKLWLKGKEVIADPQKQYEIAREVHHRAHGGINKTTAAIAEMYHWVRIKETVSDVIRSCPECSEMNKGLSAMRQNQNRSFLAQHDGSSNTHTPQSTAPQSHTQQHQPQYSPHTIQQPHHQSHPPPRPASPSHQIQMEAQQLLNTAHHVHAHAHAQAHVHTSYAAFPPQSSEYALPVDPALMEGVNLADLPPSPFLAAEQATTGVVPHMAGLEVSMSETRATRRTDSGGSAADTGGDVGVGTGGAERMLSAREEIRRRLGRVQSYPQGSH